MTTFRSLGDASAEGVRVASQDDLNQAVTRAEDARDDAEASATSAQVSADDAAQSASDAADTLAEFQTIYLGAKSVDPTLDNEGNPLIVGALYFNTTVNELRVYDGSSWKGTVLAVGTPVVDENVVVFDGTTGSAIKDSGLLYTDIVTGPVSAGTGNLAVFADTSGKVLADGGAPGGGGSGVNPSLLMNGEFRIWQENTTFSMLQGTPGFPFGTPDITNVADGWRTEALTDAVVTVDRQTDTPTGVGHSIRMNITTATTGPTAGQFTVLEQIIEALDMDESAVGTVNAKTVTLSFDVRSPVTGEHAVAFISGNDDASYVAPYTISTADTWEHKTITVPLDQSVGTWNTSGEAEGMHVSFTLEVESTYHATAANTWEAGLYYGLGTTKQVTTQVGGFYLDNVKLEYGTSETAMESRLYEQELALAQRRYERSESAFLAFNGDITSGQNYFGVARFHVEKRKQPSVSATIGSSGGFNTGTLAASTLGRHDIELSATANATQAAGFFRATWEADARFDS